MRDLKVATVLTVYGIETHILKLARPIFHALLQQYLPFTVLKRYTIHYYTRVLDRVATVLTVYGIETDSYDWCSNEIL